RRMQVGRVVEQHRVMIEAVENHMPEVIVIDEIGTELEAQAARTIAERGVQLVGTAHGRTLENLLANPTLSDLVGGVQAVTLGDEEARRRGTQKTVLERKAPPTFDVLVEQEERNLVGVHLDVAAAVDGLLRGEAPQREMRERQADGSIRRWVERAVGAARADGVGLPSHGTREIREVRREELGQRRSGGRGALVGQRPASPWWEERRGAAAPTRGIRPFDPGANRWLDPELARGAALLDGETEGDADDEDGREEADGQRLHTELPTGVVYRRRRIYPIGVNRNRLEQAIRELGVPGVISRDERDADVLLVLKSLYRKQPDQIDAAQAAGMPVYVLRSSSVDRLREAVADMFRPDIARANRSSEMSAESEDQE
ncbi:MAG: R3H domain-containing nucleic acid-binding protein, partial [Ktedonobacterales bacterium]